jgi:dynamin 1-like protein
VFKFSSEYKTLIEGSIVNPNLNKSYIGAANINTLLTQHFKNEITSIDPFDKLTNEEILIVINNTKGLKPSLFIPEDAFEVLVKQQIQRLEEPSLRYVKKIYNELINSLDLIDVKEIKRYKLLESKIKEIMIATINQCLAPTNQMVKNIIQIELSFINSSHPDFLSDGTMKEEMQRYNEVNDVEVKLNCNDLQFSEREIMEINIIRNLIVSYFNVVKKNICDVIPKTIVCFLVNKTKEISEYSMVEKLYKSNEDIKKLLMEDNAVIEKRKEIKDNLSFLKNALLVLEKESNN